MMRSAYALTRHFSGAIATATAISLLFIASSSHAAKLKGFAWTCQEKQELCYWHKPIVDPPKGWSEDESWTTRYKAMVMFPNGDKSRNKPVMYVRAHAGDAGQSIENYISTAQERWKKKLPDSTIEALPDLQRTGKPTIKVFLYKNPSQADQAFELTAFMKDTDEANPKQHYFFQVVLSSPNRPQLDKAKSAFYDVLTRL